MRTLIALCLVLAACTDGKNGPDVRSAATTCGGDLYDGCASNDDCSSGLCKLYANRGVQVCTQTCSASEPCPEQNGQPVVCNNMGLCRPDAANACPAE